MLLQEAVEFVDRLNDFASEREISAALPQVLGLWGIEYFGFARFPRPGEDVSDILLAENAPPVWRNRYIDEKYLHIDPCVKLARNSFYPFKFVDAPDPENLAQQMVKDLSDLGLSNAVIFPVGSQSGAKGVVWTQGKHFNPTAHAFLHTVILYTYERLTQLKKQPERAVLTPREVEVLKWVAAGKSSWETGEILRISQKTVESHIASIVRKLDAGNRTHAVAIAVRNRIIAP